MPGMVDPFTDEKEQLLASLEQQRYQLRLTAYGLTDDQARATHTPSSLSVGGLIKHVTAVESHWIDMVVGSPHGGGADEGEYGDNFRMRDDETLAALLESYVDAGRRTEHVVGDVDDLLRPVPVPRDVPWFPDDLDAWNVRWVLLHLVQETARHAGHADIVRELVDGATAFPLMAAAEDWPATPWMEPWRPPA